MPYKISDEQLINDLIEVKNFLNKYPSYEDMKKFGNFGVRTYQRRFGPTWNDVKKRIGYVPDYIYLSQDTLNTSAVDCAWLAGIVDGEGCFRIQRPSPSNKNNLSRSYSPVFSISTRNDDIEMLHHFKKIIGKNVKVHTDYRGRPSDTENARPAFKIFIRDIPTLYYKLIPLLETYPLKSKKLRDFLLFKKAVTILINKWKDGRKNMGYTNLERIQLDNLYLALHEIKKYKSNFSNIIEKYNIDL